MQPSRLPGPPGPRIALCAAAFRPAAAGPRLLRLCRGAPGCGADHPKSAFAASSQHGGLGVLLLDGYSCLRSRVAFFLTPRASTPPFTCTSFLSHQPTHPPHGPAEAWNHPPTPSPTHLTARLMCDEARKPTPTDRPTPTTQPTVPATGDTSKVAKHPASRALYSTA